MRRIAVCYNLSLTKIFLLRLWEHPGVVRILSEANAGVPQAISQLFAVLYSRQILEVIYKPRDWAL